MLSEPELVIAEFELVKKTFISAVQRTCSKDYPVPNSSYTVPKGLMVNFPPGENCFKNQGLEIISKEVIFYQKIFQTSLIRITSILKIIRTSSASLDLAKDQGTVLVSVFFLIVPL